MQAWQCEAGHKLRDPWDGRQSAARVALVRAKLSIHRRVQSGLPAWTSVCRALKQAGRPLRRGTLLVAEAGRYESLSLR